MTGSSTVARREEEAPLLMKPRKDVIGDPEAFAHLSKDLEVLARSQPTDKYALVLGLKAEGAVVAVTGDGTNDAPALRKADVGFAMGITGKEVAKRAADIVLLDDNFESIVKAVKWGRNIYDNIRRFLQFQVTVNVVAVITAFVGATILQESPLSAVQLLWINLVMDTFASLALATEPANDSLLDRPPHSRNDYLINKLMARNILGQAAYQLCVMFCLIFTGECWIPEQSSPHYEQFEGVNGFSQFATTCGNGRTVTPGRRFFPFSHVEEYRREWTLEIGPSRHYTVVFNVFVWLQIFNMINARKIHNEVNVFKGMFSSPLFLIIIAVIIGGQILLVEFGRYALSVHLDGLTMPQWFLSLALGSGSLLVGFLLHILPATQLTFMPETGRKEEDMMTAPRNLALASRGRISTDRLSTRLAAGLHNVGVRPASTSRLGEGKDANKLAFMQQRFAHSFSAPPRNVHPGISQELSKSLIR